MVILKLLLLPIKLLGQLLKKLAKPILLYFSKLTWKSYWAILGGAFALFASFWGFYAHYNPVINLVFNEPLESDNIFTSRFTIENNGNSNIYNTMVGYEIKNIKISFGSNTASSAKITVTHAANYPMIEQNKKQVIDINLIDTYIHIPKTSQYPITSYNADLEWYIQYDYWYGSRTQRDTLSFYTSELTDGKIIWYSNQ